jgi:hypothetical protein
MGICPCLCTVSLTLGLIKKAKEWKLSHTLLTGTEKKLKGSAKLWYLLGLNYKCSCTNLYFLCKSYVAAVNLFISSARRLERRPVFLHRLSPRLTRLSGLVPQSEFHEGIRFSCQHSGSPHTSCSCQTRFEAENPPLLSWALLLASCLSMDLAAGVAELTVAPVDIAPTTGADLCGCAARLLPSS